MKAKAQEPLGRVPLALRLLQLLLDSPDGARDARDGSEQDHKQVRPACFSAEQSDDSSVTRALDLEH